MAFVLYHDHDDDDDDHQAYYDGKNYDHRSIEQLRREAGLARPTRGNDDNDHDHDNYDDLQIGRGRTTNAMVVACLVKEIQITTELK